MMRWAASILKTLDAQRSAQVRKAVARTSCKLACEWLEPRELLDGGIGVDYTLMGGKWDNSRPVSFSFAPDGVNWDQATNNVNASLNAEYGGPGWRRLVAQALQTWSAVTNLNFQLVGDGPFDFNGPGVNQGDPSFGDIRVGGYNLGTTATIARTYGPPPNGQTGAGDVELNTGFNFGPGQHFDLETVLIHELGHSLGLGESPQPSSVMYTYYEGVRQALSPYDIEGIQSLYGARHPDDLHNTGRANSPSNAVDLTRALNPLNQGQFGGLGLSKPGDTEYFTVSAPPINGATLHVAAIAQGFSLMSPKLSVIDPSTGATLAVDAHPDQNGNIAFDSVSGIQAGHRYVLAVTGATNDVFSVGAYGLALRFFGGTPVTPPRDAFAYNNSFATATDLGTNTQPTLGYLTLPSSTDEQIFTFQATNPGRVLVAALGANITVANSSGQTILSGTGLLGFNQTKGSRYYLILQSQNGDPVSNYAFCVRTPSGIGASLAMAPSNPTPVPSTVEVTPASTAQASAKFVVSASVPNGRIFATVRPPHQVPGTGIAV